MKKSLLRKGNFDDVANFNPLLLNKKLTAKERKEISKWIANYKADNPKRVSILQEVLSK